MKREEGKLWGYKTKKGRPKKPKIVAALIVAILLIPSVYAATITDTTGTVTSTVTVCSADGKACVTIPAGIIAKDAASNPLKEVTVTIPSALPAGMPSGVEYVGYAYDFGPAGAIFGQPVEISITFEPAKFEGKTPVIYAYEEGTWKALETTLVGNKATTKVDHFSIFVLFAVKLVPTPIPTLIPVVTSTPPPMCPEGCECLTEEEAKKLGYALCNGEKTLCGYDQYQNPMYCYEIPAMTPTPISVCPEGCECLTEEEAKKLGYALCKGEKTLWGYDQYQNPIYCYEIPTVIPTSVIQLNHAQQGACV